MPGWPTARNVAVGRVGPVVEQRAEIDQWVAEGGHVPVEEGDHPIRLAGGEHAVVELEIVVDERHPLRRRDMPFEPGVRCAHGVVVSGVGDQIPALLPALDLALDEPVPAAEIG